MFLFRITDRGIVICRIHVVPGYDDEVARRRFLHDGQGPRNGRLPGGHGERDILRPGRRTRIGIGGDRYGLVPRCRRVIQLDVISTPVSPRYCGNGHRLGDGPVGVGGHGDGLCRSTSRRDGDSGRADGEVGIASGLGDGAGGSSRTATIRSDRQLRNQ